MSRLLIVYLMQLTLFYALVSIRELFSHGGDCRKLMVGRNTVIMTRSLLICIQEVAYGIAVATGVVALMQLLLIPFFWLIDLMTYKGYCDCNCFTFT
ncbi:hypothetical protein V3C99_006664 [Haemonchus contortus]